MSNIIKTRNFDIDAYNFDDYNNHHLVPSELLSLLKILPCDIKYKDSSALEKIHIEIMKVMNTANNFHEIFGEYTQLLSGTEGLTFIGYKWRVVIYFNGFDNYNKILEECVDNLIKSNNECEESRIKLKDLMNRNQIFYNVDETSKAYKIQNGFEE